MTNSEHTRDLIERYSNAFLASNSTATFIDHDGDYHYISYDSRENKWAWLKKNKPTGLYFKLRSNDSPIEILSSLLDWLQAYANYTA